MVKEKVFMSSVMFWEGVTVFGKDWVFYMF